MRVRCYTRRYMGAVQHIMNYHDIIQAYANSGLGNLSEYQKKESPMTKWNPVVLVTIIIIVAIVGLLSVALVSASPTAHDLPAVEPPLDIDGFLGLVLFGLTVPVAASLVTLLTSVLKRVIPDTIPSNAIALVLQLVIWVAWLAANQFGYGDLFNQLIPNLTDVLKIILSISGLTISSTLAAQGYHAARDNNVWIIGHQRAA